MVNFLSEIPIPTSFRPIRSIGGFTATVTTEELGDDELEITTHPVQQGADITDHAFKKPAGLSIRAAWDSSVMPIAELYQKLLELQSSRIPFDVVTGKRVYKNMLMKGLSKFTDKETENVLSVSMTLQEIIIVSIEVATVPPRSRQANPGTTGATENAGGKAAQPVTDSKRQSALRALAG